MKNRVENIGVKLDGIIVSCIDTKPHTESLQGCIIRFVFKMGDYKNKTNN